MNNKKHLTPITDICFVTGSEYEIISAENISIDAVGEKAFGLASLPPSWTLPFFVISKKMMHNFRANRNFHYLHAEWMEGISSAARYCGFDKNDLIIVRSNACIEGLEQRGKYMSLEGCFREWPELIEKCFNDFIDQENNINVVMPVLIQKKESPLLQGHISNERRIAKEIRDWKGELEVSPPLAFSIAIRNWRSKLNVNAFLEKQLTCVSVRRIEDTLLIPCTWATNQRIRIHFEWIFNGKNVYIVQADEEKLSDGINPKSILGELDVKSICYSPQCLHLLENNDFDRFIKFSKVQNPLLYHRLGLTIAPLYILDNEEVLSSLYEGKISESLKIDINTLITKSLIIRTDIDTDKTEDRQLLPRTCEIRTLSDAIHWLKTEYKKLRDSTSHKIIFILHNFIPAYSSAFAYASPGEKEVKIEALWGIPEGLYYYSHDKYTVNTLKKDLNDLKVEEFSINTVRQYKKYFVHPMKNGNWEVQTLAKPFDWSPAIPKDSWVKEIACATRKIAEKEQRSVSVMWFIGVDEEKYGCNIFPWYHEPYDYSETKATPRNKLSFEKTLTIHTMQDLEALERRPRNTKETVRNLLIQPTDAQILRNRDLIDRIGRIAQSLGVNIILEGGILSHAYYQLQRTGARVEVRNPFVKSQNLEFNKLVRDRIPEKISNNGEQAITSIIESEALVQLLKRKLVEEALEVYDAKNYDESVSEIADLMEVLENLILQLGIKEQEILDVKQKKKMKVGGFEKGIYLKRTSTPAPPNEAKVIEDSESVDIKSYISKSTDLREYSTASESFTRIKVPVDIEKWEVHPSVKAGNIDVILKGERQASTLKIEISIFEGAEQLSLFDK